MNGGKTSQKRDPSVASAILLVGLIAGLIATLAVPIGFGTYYFMKTIAEESDLAYNEQQTKKIVQNPAILEVEPGKEYLAGSHTRCKVTVEQSYFPIIGEEIQELFEGEKLVAVKVKYHTENTNNREKYQFTGGIYIGFDQQFRNALTMYDISGYQNLFSSENILDSWDLCLREQGEGIFLFLVPEGIEQICFYMDSRQEDTNDIQKIYQIPLTIGAGEGV